LGYLSDNLILIGASFLAGVAMVVSFVLVRKRKTDKTKISLEELVTLDSKGWLVLTLVTFVGTLIMVGSAMSIGIDYWVGLAIDADQKADRIPLEPGFFDVLTVGVVGFFFLALTFESLSDLGTPLASGLKQRKKPLLPELVFAATVGCIIMSLVTKWGYYDDKRSVRLTDNAQMAVEDQSWVKKREEAQALIDALASTPSETVADQMEAAANSTIEELKAQLADATAARDKLPEAHSTNRIKAGERIADISTRLQEAENKLIDVALMRDEIARLAKAKIDRDTANEKIKETAGLVDDQGQGRTPAGDYMVVRALRVGLHQFLCWLLPLIFFEARSAYSETKRKEKANEKRAKTRRKNANTYDAEYSEVDPFEDRDPLRLGAGGYYEERSAAEQAELDRLKEEQSQAEGPNGVEPNPGYENGEQASHTETETGASDEHDEGDQPRRSSE